MNFRFPATVALLIVVVQPALARADTKPTLNESEPSLTSLYKQCEESAHSEDPALRECESAEFQRQDERLNANYKLLLAELPKPKGVELRKVQRAWLAYAESRCAFLYDGDAYNGSMNRLAASHCAVVERARRADELELLRHY